MLKGVKCVLGYVGMEEHQRCMIDRPGPPCGVEPSILQMITRPNMERVREGVVFSPSSISACHRRETLVGQHDWYLDVEQGYKMVRGTIIHEGMGQEPPYPGVAGVVRELRMAAPINTKYGEQKFHGKPDLVVLLRVEGVPIPDEPVMEPVPHHETFHMHHRLYVKIVDYKTRGEIGHDLVRPDEKHVYQVNEYAWLVQQFLPFWLNARPVADEKVYEDHLFLTEGVTLPHIDEVVVDELSISYMDMKRTRTFTSKGFLYDRGKMLSDKINGHWIRRNPPEYEELELEPIHQFKPAYVESIIRRGIEEQIEAQTMLAPPVTGEDAKIMCRSCPVRQACYDTGLREGYGMKDQEPYVIRSRDNRPENQPADEGSSAA